VEGKLSGGRTGLGISCSIGYREVCVCLPRDLLLYKLSGDSQSASLGKQGHWHARVVGFQVKTRRMKPHDLED